MDPSILEASMERAESLKVEEMVNLFEKMDGKGNRQANRILMQPGNLEYSPAKAEEEAEDAQALISIPRSNNIPRELQKDTDRGGSPFNTSLSGSSLIKDVEMAKIKKEKILTLIEAWEESKKKKSLHRYNKRMAKLDAWEGGKIARAQANLRTFEERLENRRATYVEKTSNKIAVVQKIAEEKRALAEECHGHEVLKAEETAAKCRASGLHPGSSFLMWW